jgi:DNA-3-methyladenine glycosylase I
MIRCHWADSDPLLCDYHDREWGVPVHDDRRLFEFLVLEGAQAGLSWLTILRRRAAYREVFCDFDPAAVARLDGEDLTRILTSTGVIRNRRKVESAVRNAAIVVSLAAEHGSFAAHAWSFVGGQPRQNAWRAGTEVPAQTDESRAMSRDLVTRGAGFVGPTICYAFMQATGMVNDHLASCFRYRAV